MLTGAALLGGWVAITAAIAPVAPRLVWLVSLGLLLWSLAGWRLLWVLVTRGLYALMAGGPRA